jgi:hypothetical protein
MAAVTTVTMIVSRCGNAGYGRYAVMSNGFLCLDFGKYPAPAKFWWASARGETPFWSMFRLPYVREFDWTIGSYYLEVPLWLVVSGASAAASVMWLFRRIVPSGHCNQCGYDLTGNVSGTCPECGLQISPSWKVEDDRRRQ